MFMAASINNIVAVLYGTDYYFEQADVGDYMFMINGIDIVETFDQLLEDSEYVKEYRKEKVSYVIQDNILHDGKNIEGRNSVLLQNFDDKGIHYFTKNNDKITDIPKGKIYISHDIFSANDLKEGDVITIKVNDIENSFEILGSAKDALLGSPLVSNSRILMNPEDYELYMKDEEFRSQIVGEIFYVFTDDTKKIEKIISEKEGVVFSENKSTFKLGYIMDMIAAGLLMIVGIFLILISFMVLKFTINLTMAEEFREIGVMKAIGLRNQKIRNLYIVKYLGIGIIGAFIGFLGSIPFSDMLLTSVGENIVLGNSIGIWLHILSAVAVVLVILGYTYHCTNKVKKASPVDAIRNGQTGERFRKKSIYRLEKSHRKPSSYMAWNDIFSSPKKFTTIILVFMLCSLLVFVLENTVNTMQSDKVAYTFGKVTDVYYEDANICADCMKEAGKERTLQNLQEFEKKLAEKGYDVTACVDVQYKFKVEFDGESYSMVCQQGVNTKTEDYVYYEGSAPSNEHEIAISNVIADMTGAKIGDIFRITIDDSTEDYLITAYYQTMNQMGKIIRLHEDLDTKNTIMSSIFGFQFDFNDHPSSAEVKKRIDDLNEEFDEDKYITASEFTRECIGVVDTMEMIGLFLFIIVLLVMILVAILMERSFISDEKKEIAILKAVGFRDISIVKWHMTRFAIVELCSVLLGVLLSVPVTNLCFNPIFSMMGMKTMPFSYNWFMNLVVIPAIILAVTMVSVGLTSLFIRNIHSSDCASIE